MKDEQTIFKPPPPTKYNTISLGAGVQSSAMSLMAAKGEIGPMPDAAIFADTQAEPKAVYDWLDWLERQLPFPVYRVTKGSLTEAAITMRLMKDGRRYSKTDIPFFTKSADGATGMIRQRSCTRDYKILPVTKAIRKIANIRRGQTETTVTHWIGISWDELQRMRASRDKFIQNRYPLVEMKLERRHLIEWMKSNGFPEPPRSACIYCPFHHDREWRRMRDESPDEFQKAIDFEKAVQLVKAKGQNGQHMVYLHRSCRPLSEIDFDNDVDKGQELFGFMQECEGMCGV